MPRWPKRVTAEETRVRRNKYAREYAQRPEKKLRRKAYHYQWRYGITLEELEQLKQKQKGLCAICGENPGDQLDHDHDTGKVRGLLCIICNQALGLFGDNLPGIMRVVAYLEKNG